MFAVHYVMFDTLMQSASQKLVSCQYRVYNYDATAVTASNSNKVIYSQIKNMPEK